MTTMPVLEWILDKHTPIPIDRFGADHWSTFAYVETRAVDRKGYLGHDHMRCSARLHPELYALKNPYSSSDGGRYPTKIKAARNDDGSWGAEALQAHDDYSCLSDCIAAGLLVADMPIAAGQTWQTATGDYITPKMVGSGAVSDPDRITPRDRKRLMGAARWRLTPLGVAVASQLRQHHAEGGAWHDFVPDMAKARRDAA
ncbi:hypothetical protein [Nonomuraea sp. NPDC023979]|uniref:hypothetical protein n=1 Tax=Nonomuraea sp. NPDC023979 TaxID=3154796 RepID=UPI0033D1F23F